MAAGPATAGYKQEPGIVSSALPQPLREIGFDQNIDQRVPLDTTFRDEAGATVRLGDYFGRRPVVLVFAYYDCPMLCTQVINGLSSALGMLSLEPGQGLRDRHRQLQPARHAGARRPRRRPSTSSATSGPAPPTAGIS